MVTIVGSGVGGYDFDNISVDLESYEMVFCDRNYISNLPNVVKGGFREIRDAILDNLDKNIIYVVSGSPLFFSGALVILSHLKKLGVNFKIIDNTSSLNYLLAKMGISLTQTNTVSLHGKSKIDLENFLTKRYTFILCDEKTPYYLKDAIRYLDKSDISITLGERFGYSDETIREVTIDEVVENPPKMPYSLLIERRFTPLATISSEDEIEHENGMITKEYKRHISLQNLNLKPNLLMWDIGAGSGSISIDGYKRYRVKSIMFEKSIKRAEMIERSLARHKIVDAKLYIGEASEDYKVESSTPQRIFIGGGGEKVIRELDYLYNRLEEGGLMVANFVTLTHLTRAINTLKEAGIEFNIKSISLTTYKTHLLLPNPERVMHQIIIKK